MCVGCEEGGAGAGGVGVVGRGQGTGGGRGTEGTREGQVWQVAFLPRN